MHKNVITITKLAAAVLAAVAVAGCEAEKSRNPLSPNVAGPIGGVSISPPVPITPVNGAEVLNNAPVKLVFNNASSNGVRPFWYVVELASDAGFTTKLYASSKVTPASGAQTSVVVDATLTTDRTYYWRVKADDGANASEFSGAAKFDFVAPVVIEAPVPMSPVSGLMASSTRPPFVVNNAGVQGRAGKVEYWFEISMDQAFTKTFMQIGVERSSGAQTTMQPPELPSGTLLFWRVAGFNGTNHGPVVAHAELPNARVRAVAVAEPLAFARSGAACRRADTRSASRGQATPAEHVRRRPADRGPVPGRAPELLSGQRRKLGVHGSSDERTAEVRQPVGIQRQARQRE